MPRLLFIGGGASPYPCKLLKTGQTTQYNSELDDGYYEKGVAKSYTVLTTGQYANTVNVDLTHLDANTGVSFDAASKEIRGTGLMGVFKAAGDETIVVTGSASNNGVFTTAATGTADKIIVTGTIVNESAGAPVVIAKREAMSNNCVLDNNTGLMWSRYFPLKFGVAGDGLMPATGKPYDIYQYCAMANSVLLGGYADWRIPNVFELFSLADFQPTTGHPDSTAFPITNNGVFGTSTVTPRDTAQHKEIQFLNSYVWQNNNPNNARLVFLVRGG